MKEVTEMWPFLLDGITGVKKISCNLIILLKFLFSLLLQAFSTVKHSMPSFLEGIRITHICKKDHRFTSLPENQGNTGRHKCTGCAFERVMELKAKGIPMCNDDSILADLPESQAGTVRHKDAFEGYKMAYQA